VEISFHPVAFRYFDVVEYLQTLLLNQTDVVRRKQELIQSRVFELQYSLEGRHEVEGAAEGLVDGEAGNRDGDDHLIRGGVPGVPHNHKHSHGTGAGHSGALLEPSNAKFAGGHAVGQINLHKQQHGGGQAHHGHGPVHGQGHGFLRRHPHGNATQPRLNVQLHSPSVTLSTWPRYADGRPMRDAFDIIIDLCLGNLAHV
jgi:hypothetical protein